MNPDDIKNRTTYHPPTRTAQELHQHIRDVINNAMTEVAASVPDGREQSLALTKLEEAMFWANAGIARNHDAL